MATVPANGSLKYYDHNRNPRVVYNYYIVSIDAQVMCRLQIVLLSLKSVVKNKRFLKGIAGLKKKIKGTYVCVPFVYYQKNYGDYSMAA